MDGRMNVALITLHKLCSYEYYMYRTVVTICTAQWSLYVPHSGHYTNRTVVTICTDRKSVV